MRTVDAIERVLPGQRVEWELKPEGPPGTKWAAEASEIGGRLGRGAGGGGGGGDDGGGAGAATTGASRWKLTLERGDKATAKSERH